MPSRAWAPTNRREVVSIDFNSQTGEEKPDRHPMLVLSPRAFNERTSLVVGLPMTHSARHETNPFSVKWVGAAGGVGCVIGNQPESFDWRARSAEPHPWKRAPEAVFTQACEALNQIVALCG